MASMAIAVGIYLLPLKRVNGDTKQKLLQIDYGGSILTIISSVLVLLGLNWGGVTFPWTSAAVLVPLCLGVAVFAVFLVWEAKYAKLPIIPTHIFRNKTVVGVYIVTLLK
jgi:hypothetical protein